MSDWIISHLTVMMPNTLEGGGTSILFFINLSNATSNGVSTITNEVVFVERSDPSGRPIGMTQSKCTNYQHEQIEWLQLLQKNLKIAEWSIKKFDKGTEAKFGLANDV